MGCKASKDSSAIGLSKSLSMRGETDVTRVSTDDLIKGTRSVGVNSPERVYKLLEKALLQQRRPTSPGGGMDLDTLDDLTEERQKLYNACMDSVRNTKNAKVPPAQYRHPLTLQTPLHLACRLVDVDQNQMSAKELCRVMDALLKSYPEALEAKDYQGHVPLHYAIAPTQFYVNAKKTTTSKGYIVASPAIDNESANDEEDDRECEDWRARGIFAQHLFHSNLKAAHAYWQQSDVIFDDSESEEQLVTGGCSPLYRVLQTLPDDFDRSGPTVDYIKVLLQASYWHDEDFHEELKVDSNYNNMAGVGNASDGDKPLGLLYRRFTRQFDISEMFFPGDNSRPEVVRHREKYKFAAGNTWKIIEALLKPPAQHVQESLASSPEQISKQSQEWGIVHRAVQMETPPDLLRYIVETNAQDLTKVDGMGNLPLHYAAMVKPPKPTTKSGERDHDTTHFPSFYSKYVMDELLYKFPEAASMTNGEGKFPLTLAVSSGKQFIGGGIRSLYHAFPKALGQIDLRQKQHISLRRALSIAGDAEEDEDPSAATVEDEYKEAALTSEESLLQQAASTKESDGIIRDDDHDCIMLVQKSDVDCREVAIAMWAHEEDAGVQMLGCCAISRLLGQVDESTSADEYSSVTLRTALTATAAVVNAMKAHPNEMIVQEKACAALQVLAPADGRREVSMVASGAVASVVAAMQAHVGDSNVQKEACGAITAIVKHGGGDRATVVASVSGVTAILNALAAHPSSIDVQIQALQALWELTDLDESNASMPELPREQAEPLLAQAKENFPAECRELVEKLRKRLTAKDDDDDDDDEEDNDDDDDEPEEVQAEEDQVVEAVETQ